MQLVQLAQAARYTSQYELANDSYRAALKLQPSLTEIGVEWADLFSRKYASELAAQTLEESSRSIRTIPTHTPRWRA